jgi:hypothetical protein
MASIRFVETSAANHMWGDMVPNFTCHMVYVLGIFSSTHVAQNQDSYN